MIAVLLAAAGVLFLLRGGGTTATAVITVDGKTITVTGLTSGTAIWIDCGIMDVFNSDRSASLLKDASGEFPTLAMGANTITGSGWSKLEIYRKERFL